MPACQGHLAPLVLLVNPLLAVALQGQHGGAVDDGVAAETVVDHLVVTADGTSALKFMAIHLGRFKALADIIQS